MKVKIKKNNPAGWQSTGQICYKCNIPFSTQFISHLVFINQKPDCLTSLVVRSNAPTSHVVKYLGLDYANYGDICPVLMFRDSECGGLSPVQTSTGSNDEDCLSKCLALGPATNCKDFLIKKDGTCELYNDKCTYSMSASFLGHKIFRRHVSYSTQLGFQTCGGQVENHLEIAQYNGGNFPTCKAACQSDPMCANYLFNLPTNNCITYKEGCQRNSDSTYDNSVFISGTKGCFSSMFTDSTCGGSAAAGSTPKVYNHANMK